MKIIKWILLVSALSFIIFYLSESTKFNTDKQIKEIEQKVQTINNVKYSETKTLNNEELVNHVVDGGAQLVGFFSSGKIIKISEHLGLSYAVRSFEYYFFNDSLIYVHESEESYPYDDIKAELDYTKLVPNFEGKYYFNQNKLIERQTVGEKRFPEEINLESMLLKTAKENVILLSK
jgi:hypothetical protein